MKVVFSILLFLAMAIAGCRNNETHPASGEVVHSHGAGSVPYTAFSDSCEYFAEIKPMIKGKQAEASIHITRLRDHKPFTQGVMGIRVIQNGKLVGEGDTNMPRIPGIFPVKFSTSTAGVVSLEFTFSSEGFKDSVVISQAMVFNNEAEAKNAPLSEEPSGVIKFTKEMAWKIDFHVLKVLPHEYRNTINVSGELLVPPSEINTVTAKSDGILVYRRADLVSGTKIEKGSVLFALTGQGLTARNMDANISGMKSRFEASKAAYEREKILVDDQIVSRKQFNETSTRYQVDSIQYFTYLNGLSGNNMNISSPANGYVQQLYQSNGNYVAEGTPLITIVNTGKIMLRADLPQQYWPEGSQISSASFRLSGSNKVYDLDEVGGKLIATGSAVSADNQFIPVTFEFSNNGSFVPGSFAEVFLKTKPLQNQLVIPVSSLMEEQGNYYVYVQIAGESYLKRTVKPGFMDGAYASILSGLTPGDRVVTRGAIFIKASSQMTGTPSHGHEH